MARAVKNWLPVFLHFCSLMRISSKEATEPVPIIPYGAQRIFLEEMEKGLSADAHHFVCLKARQLGISTIMLALDIFWLYMHPGLQGALIADTSDNKVIFRQTIIDMLESLPAGYQVQVKSHNRNALILANGSRLQYMSAGTRKNSGLGRSRALNFVHATECSSWGDQKGLDSLLAALAAENPNRLYVFESTALGYNLFYDMYQEATKAFDQRAFFIGWWSKGPYSIPEFLDGAPSPEFGRWWGQNPVLTAEEKNSAAIVARDYGHEITPEQWAWYRKTGENRAISSLKEEFPSYASEAFQVTGSSFFLLPKIGADVEFIRNNGVSFSGYRYTLGHTFTAMRVEKTTTAEETTLRIWEEPKAGARYVIGVDPTFGESENADNGVVQVYRAFADKLVQVAEFASPQVETHQIAWAMAHLAGCYKDCIINIEVTGPGTSVMHEMEHLRQQITFGQLRESAQSLGIVDALDRARWFLYHRPENIGAGYTWNWKTTWENKLAMFNSLRDAYNTDQMVIRSIPLLEEMTTLVQKGKSIAASGRNKDDRIMASGLAHYAWARWVRAPMMADNRTYKKEMDIQKNRETISGNVIEGIIPNFFARQVAARTETELRNLLENF